MPTAFTPQLQLPYPEGSDPAAVPKDIKALADKLDGIVLPAANPQNLQPGDLVLSAAAVRAGCLICDGAPYNRATYAALYAALGGASSPFGQGDGSTTFNVPDYRGRTILGAGAGPGLTTRNRGDKGGEETHTLTVAEVATHAHGVTDPGHGHGVSDPGHAHSVYDPTHAHVMYSRTDFPRGTGANVAAVGWGGSGGGTYAAGTGVAVYGAGTGIGIQGNGTGVSVQNAGANGAHNNMPPNAVANVFIKT